MVRCKFSCQSKTETKSGGSTLYSYFFTAVYSDSEENKKFWTMTPSGQLTVSCVRNGSFKVGQEYYLDISEANE
jgi:hypothetical protein